LIPFPGPALERPLLVHPSHYGIIGGLEGCGKSTAVRQVVRKIIAAGEGGKEGSGQDELGGRAGGGGLGGAGGGRAPLGGILYYRHEGPLAAFPASFSRAFGLGGDLHLLGSDAEAQRAA
jgi:hypothetical protein